MILKMNRHAKINKHCVKYEKELVTGSYITHNTVKNLVNDTTDPEEPNQNVENFDVGVRTSIFNQLRSLSFPRLFTWKT